jgi:hypothetical protein
VLLTHASRTTHRIQKEIQRIQKEIQTDWLEDFRMMSASKEATSMPDARRLRALYSVKK